MKIAVLDWYTVNISGDIPVSKLEELGEVKIIPLTKPEETAENIGDADIVLCNKVLITREVMDACPNIKYIGLFATGYNNVDIACAAEKGIVVCNAGQYSTNAVAQQTFAYILDHFSRIRDYDSAVKAGEWERSPAFSYFPIPTSELAGRTLSIVGYGSIGRKAAEIGHAFGMNIVVSTRTVPADCPYEVTDIFTAAEKADVLTFHCPLTEDSLHMFNFGTLGKIKPGAVIINTSRGALIDADALLEGIKTKKIGAACLDVYEEEASYFYEDMSQSIIDDDTLSRLISMPNVIVTSHQAFLTKEALENIATTTIDNIRQIDSGEERKNIVS